MIEGNLEDISLPGLLQLLASESTKSYRLRISKGGQNGDVFVCDGHLLVATFGILEGLDALSEFLNWSDGEFVVEKLPSHFKTTIRSNINLNLSDPGCFADQCAFLYESNVGLNTEIVPSRTFGTAEWQDALHVQPLEKEDYAILGWITDGRTMRQAMREFQFDLKKTIGVLYRLLITRSVEVVRPTAYSEQPAGVDEFVKLANKELAKHTPEPAKKDVTVEFHATDIGGARARPRDTGNSLRALTPAAASDNALTRSPEPAGGGDGKSSSKDEKVASDAKSQNAGDAKSSSKEEAQSSAKDDGKSPSKDDAKSATSEGASKVQSNGDAKASPNADAKSPGKDDSKTEAKDGEAKSAKQSNVGTDTVETSAVKSDEPKNLSDAMDGDSDELHDNFKKQLKKAASMAEVVSPKSAAAAASSAEMVASSGSAVAAKTASSAGSGTSEKTSTTATKLPPVSPDSVGTIATGASSANASNASPTAEFSKTSTAKDSDSSKSAGSPDGSSQRETGDRVPTFEEATKSSSLNAIFAAEFDEESVDMRKVELPDPDKVLNVVAAPVAKAFDERRTDPLPLVSIDIERLLASTFQLTAIGQRAVTNTSLDELLKKVLLDVEKGKTLLLVLTDSNRSESVVLASYRYCLDRGYIEHTDPVMSLTVDLLLGKMELEQYLLQRRRITGDQLRDMMAISHRQGIGLDKLLVAAGYMLPIDMERVKKEKERFCPR